MTPPRNSWNGVALKWLANIVGVVVTTGAIGTFGWYATRTVALEATAASHEAKIGGMKDQLTRIEDKIDRILER